MKTEEWDEKMKLSNQYRGLDTEEYGFLAARAREQREKERQVADEESREIASYREYVNQGEAVLVSNDVTEHWPPSTPRRVQLQKRHPPNQHRRAGRARQGCR
jgi:hypothetical protein